MLVLLTLIIAFGCCSTRPNFTSDDSVSNTVRHSDARQGRKLLNRLFSRRRRLKTRQDWHNLSVVGRDTETKTISDDRQGREINESRYYSNIRGGKGSTGISDQPKDGHAAEKEKHNTTDIHSTEAKQPVNNETGVPFNWTGFVGGMRKHTILEKISHLKDRLEAKENWLNRAGKGDRKLETISSGRKVRAVQKSGVDATIPDGFAHYYAPTSNVANVLMLYVVQPQHAKFLNQALGMTGCLRYKMKHLDMLTLGQCFDGLGVDAAYPAWLVHLIGFVVVCCILLLIALFMMMLCPCLMCWQISFGQVVQAGKLDTYSNVSWAMITFFGYLTILVAAFGVISVGCAGIGMGYYLWTGQMTHVYVTYEVVQAIALEAVDVNGQSRSRETHRLKVRAAVDPRLSCSLRPTTLQDGKPARLSDLFLV